MFWEHCSRKFSLRLLASVPRPTVLLCNASVLQEIGLESGLSLFNQARRTSFKDKIPDIFLRLIFSLMYGGKLRKIAISLHLWEHSTSTSVNAERCFS